jgi:hypothetical protein
MLAVADGSAKQDIDVEVSTIRGSAEEVQGRRLDEGNGGGAHGMRRGWTGVRGCSARRWRIHEH